MRTQGSSQRVADIARLPLARQQQVGRGEATPRGLVAGLSKGLLQIRRVGHGKARAVDEVNLMAAPALGGRQRIGVEALLGNRILQAMEKAKRQAAARPAVG